MYLIINSIMEIIYSHLDYISYLLKNIQMIFVVKITNRVTGFWLKDWIQSASGYQGNETISIIYIVGWTIVKCDFSPNAQAFCYSIV